ncbi:GNAT family N-acetyltransferase [Aliagarivorans marinus]|uniref:GNAT family N-acetyltransferase n=1 Tax=Aliagarivorans marinus TaxID=561965 RepID=UPI0003F9A8C4|nr:GNAT family N-acetyltransferase [Aliagarivorans marinus]
MSSITIRQAAPNDAALILNFIRQLAIYEKAEHEVLASESSIAESLFTEGATAKAVICELDGEPVGFAVYFFNYSTWLGKNGLYLEDLYVSPQARGLGAGKKLLQHLAAVALEKGCGRFEWSVLDWNTPAIEFYESLGASAQREWLGYRISGDALKALARD